MQNNEIEIGKGRKMMVSADREETGVETGVCKLVAVKPTRLSQVMHNRAFKEMGLQFRYELLDTDNTELAIREMRQQSLRGYSLTIPHKESVLPLLDIFSKDCQKIGAANTVINNGKGQLSGYNTDWQGITRSLEEAQFSNLDKKKVLLFGAGGAARAAVFAAQHLGASDILIVNRTLDRAKVIAKDFSVKFCSLSELDEKMITEVDLLLNATPLGSHLADNSDQPFKQLIQELKSDALVFDMVTKEKTDLLLGAEKRGLRTISGLRMLLYQAVEQSKLFTEKSEIPVAEMEEALYQQAQKNNS